MTDQKFLIITFQIYVSRSMYLEFNRLYSYYRYHRFYTECTFRSCSISKHKYQQIMNSNVNLYDHEIRFVFQKTFHVSYLPRDIISNYEHNGCCILCILVALVLHFEVNFKLNDICSSFCTIKRYYLFQTHSND